MVSTEDFGKTSNHTFRTLSFRQDPVITTAVREAQFKHFRLRQAFRLFPRLDRVPTARDGGPAIVTVYRSTTH